MHCQSLTLPLLHVWCVVAGHSWTSGGLLGVGKKLTYYLKVAEIRDFEYQCLPLPVLYNLSFFRISSNAYQRAPYPKLAQHRTAVRAFVNIFMINTFEFYIWLPQIQNSIRITQHSSGNCGFDS